MGKLRLRKIIALASKVKQPEFEPKPVRHPQPLSTSVSHTFLPLQQAQKPGRQLGPRVGVLQFKESPKNHKTRLLLTLHSGLYLERSNWQKLQGTIIILQNYSYTIGNGSGVTFFCDNINIFIYIPGPWRFGWVSTWAPVSSCQHRCDNDLG